MRRRILAIILMGVALCIIIAIPIIEYTPAGSLLTPNNQTSMSTPTFIPSTPTPVPTAAPVLTPQGSPPTLSAKSAYMIDMTTGNVLINIDGERPQEMASTTKIMTAVIAIETGDLNQTITISQDAVNEYELHDGSNGGLEAGEKIQLKDLLYALMVPSGDDAAVAIADGLAGSQANFVNWMNLFAQRHHLYQTHYADPDGLNWQGSPDHYSTAADLTRLAAYAMQIPLFAKIAQTQEYTIPATADHLAHDWKTTDTLLGTYQGMLGIKTGFTGDAGYCLVFAAERNGHHLIGAVLNSPTEDGRFTDAENLLNWGFALPMRSPDK